MHCLTQQVYSLLHSCPIWWHTWSASIHRKISIGELVAGSSSEQHSCFSLVMKPWLLTKLLLLCKMYNINLFQHFQPVYFVWPVLALLIICCSSDVIKQMFNHWSTSCGHFLEITGYHSNNEIY